MHKQIGMHHDKTGKTKNKTIIITATVTEKDAYRPVFWVLWVQQPAVEQGPDHATVFQAQLRSE